jgi:hypothetical protein
MTLTEQWKKGELKQGEYWCKITESPYVERVYLPCCDDIIVEVLAPVPSYDHFVELTEKVKENQQLRKWCEEFNALEVAKENEQLKLIIKRTKASGNYPGRVSAYKARIIHLSEENQQLKELLKEIRSLWKGTVCMPDSQEQVRDILTKIDNAIGEKK